MDMSLGTMARTRIGSTASRRSVARAGNCLAFSLYAGLAVYCALSVSFGPAGLVAFRLLEERKAAMEANLAALGAMSGDLEAELE